MKVLNGESDGRPAAVPTTGALGAVWLRNYRRHGANHALGLLVFAAFLTAENALWLHLSAVHPAFVGWFVDAGVDVQIGMTLLCGLELAALAALSRITLR